MCEFLVMPCLARSQARLGAAARRHLRQNEIELQSVHSHSITRFARSSAERGIWWAKPLRDSDVDTHSKSCGLPDPVEVFDQRHQKVDGARFQSRGLTVDQTAVVQPL